MKLITKIFVAYIVGYTFPVMATNSFNYEMSTDAGAELIKPIIVFDNGTTTFMKFKPSSQFIIIDGKKHPTFPDVFYIDKNNNETLANYRWNEKSNTLSFPFVAKEWRVRSGKKVIGIRKIENINEQNKTNE
ncbi:TrbG/VirB9 family P-type conjugative transfer protein [Proteus mirabilis]|uniref:TrbG/VirB9 family P-type conjugative transfer protein n=1 Tax=Morganellaceae TaxID=1903414 RepID=UPI00234AF353|nr:TrbG/VirB9 family P-type conjugative transfer protein [Providencia sp. PROV271]